MSYDPPASAETQPPLLVHGLDLSYFTGKLEAYLRAKGVPYRLVEMDTAAFRRCARATGVAQMPQVECPDGTWLTDTTLIIRHLERERPAPAITPAHPVRRFLARFVEDFADEGLWRPALYYRWAFPDDARLLSARLARGMLRDVPLPFFIRRWFILQRQRHHYLRQDGITAATRSGVEALYRATLQAVSAAVAAQPFVLGPRPTEADFGLFGPMFRHFFCDPTPARIMRDTVPAVLAWVTRLWALRPADFTGHPDPNHVPDDAVPLLTLAATSHLPYLRANADAWLANRTRVEFDDSGARFRVAVNPYRVWCLGVLQGEFAALGASEQAEVSAYLGPAAAAILGAPHAAQVPNVVTALPIRSVPTGRPADREWRS